MINTVVLGLLFYFYVVLRLLVLIIMDVGGYLNS